MTPNDNVSGGQPPTMCPACGAELYPSRRSRPDPSLSTTGKLVAGIGLVSGVGVYVVGRVVLRLWARHGMLPEGAAPVGLLVLPAALIPGVGLGVLAHRMTKVLKL